MDTAGTYDSRWLIGAAIVLFFGVILMVFLILRLVRCRWRLGSDWLDLGQSLVLKLGLVGVISLVFAGLLASGFLTRSPFDRRAWWGIGLYALYALWVFLKHAMVIEMLRG